MESWPQNLKITISYPLQKLQVVYAFCSWFEILNVEYFAIQLSQEGLMLGKDHHILQNWFNPEFCLLSWEKQQS